MPTRTSPNVATPRVDPTTGTVTLPATHAIMRFDDPQGRTWLATATHFYVDHPMGGYAARKDGRAQGSGYWSAFRRFRGATFRAYLGKDANLTLERLREVGDDLAAAIHGEDAPPAIAAQPQLRIDPAIAVADVRFSDDRLWLELTDGRVIGAPLAWFPRLAGASAEDRAVWRIAGAGVQWPSLDEDISAQVLMGHSS